jgi:lipopolysaccharide/colanic/teichoic acid biosynthesis glycosyltransferase
MITDNSKEKFVYYKSGRLGKESFSSRDLADIILYIGENGDAVRRISEALGVGFSSTVAFRQAESFTPELERRKVKLTAVMIDLPYDAKGLKAFLRFLEMSVYSSVPVVYLSSGLTEGDKSELAKACLVDDIIHPTRDIFTIRERIAFIGKVKQSLLNGKNIVKVDRKSSGISDTGILKRIFDIVVSSLSILLLSPILLVIALLIKLDSSGPVFYNSYRTGRGFRVFKYFRFRTMKVGADRMVSPISRHHQPMGVIGKLFFNPWSDHRFTLVGKLLRRTGLDELPQLFNVLRGDMSIVGNRPLPLDEASSLTTNEHAERFVAPAGITGLWQVKKKNVDARSHEEMIKYDVAYAKGYNFMLDVSIILQSGKLLLRRMVDY